MFLNINKFVYIVVGMKYKMLEYDRIDLSEGIDVNKCNEHQENVVYASIIIF